MVVLWLWLLLLPIRGQPFRGGLAVAPFDWFLYGSYDAAPREFPRLPALKGNGHGPLVLNELSVPKGLLHFLFRDDAIGVFGDKVWSSSSSMVRRLLLLGGAGSGAGAGGCCWW